jgi:DNA polymerase
MAAPIPGPPSAQAALAWLIEMGADEAIAATPVDRFSPCPAAPAPAAVPPASRPPPALREAPVAPFVAAPRPPTPQAGSAEVAESARALAAACDTLEGLEAAVRRFDACPLKATATTTVFADGVGGARVMFVGEAPGADEDRVGKPFVGVSGQLLDRMLRWVDLERDRNFYIANVIYWRPPGNRTPTTAEVAICLPFIQRQIELARPEVLVFLGAAAAQTLLGTPSGITRLRGRWHPYQSPGLVRPVQALATFHPAYLLRSPAQKRESWRDLLMLKNKLSDADN